MVGYAIGIHFPGKYALLNLIGGYAVQFPLVSSQALLVRPLQMAVSAFGPHFAETIIPEDKFPTDVNLSSTPRFSSAQTSATIVCDATVPKGQDTWAASCSRLIVLILYPIRHTICYQQCQHFVTFSSTFYLQTLSKC